MNFSFLIDFFLFFTKRKKSIIELKLYWYQEPIRTTQYTNALKSIGCDTARDVLALSREVLVEKADLEESTVDEVLAILKAEFEETEN